MRIRVIEDADISDDDIEIHVNKKDDLIDKIIDQINIGYNSIEGTKDKVVYKIEFSNIYYFESVDNKTFIYTRSDIYQSRKKLYELEEMLQDSFFLRISKSCIINTAVIINAKAQFNGRILVQLKNGENALVSKHYIKSFRNKMLESGDF